MEADKLMPSLEEMTAHTPEHLVPAHAYDIGVWRGLVEAYLMLDGVVDPKLLAPLEEAISEAQENA